MISSVAEDREVDEGADARSIHDSVYDVSAVARRTDAVKY